MIWHLLMRDGTREDFNDDQAVADHFAPDRITYQPDAFLGTPAIGRLYIEGNPHTAAIVLNPKCPDVEDGTLASLLRKLNPIPE